MGIKGLQKVLQELAPLAVRTTQNKDYLKNKVAIDASIMLYQFMTTIITKDGQPLTNAQGQITSHLIGLLSRCTRMAEAGILPVFVFDGAAPEIKSGELEKRRESKRQAEEQLQKALEAGDTERATQLRRRTVKVTPEQYQQAIDMLQYLGIPCMRADGEAEALCAGLCKAGLVDAVASADLDCVAYGAPVFIRNIGTDNECIQVDFAKVLADSGYSNEQFVDLCILLGCDYVDSIPSIGPKTVITLMQKHKSIEEIIISCNEKVREKLEPNYIEKVKAARENFANASHIPDDMMDVYRKAISARGKVDIEGGIKFLVNDMQFEEKNARTRMLKFSTQKSAPKQMTLTSFVKRVDRL